MIQPPVSRHRRFLHRRYHAPAFTLAETLFSIALTGGLLVAALNTVGSSRVAQGYLSEQTCGQMLANDLVSEIMSRPYEDPDQTPVFGREAGETGSSRQDYDDVDDYANRTSQSPKRADGTPVSGFENWFRSATVEWVVPNDLLTESIVETGVKRITVTVKHGEKQVTQLFGFRTAGPPEPSSGPTLLLVVSDPANMTPQEVARKTLIESWGYTVTLIDDDATVGDFNAAAVSAVVAYIPIEVDDQAVDNKLSNFTIGVVNEESELLDELGFSFSGSSVDETQVGIVDTTHYINSGYPSAWLTIYSSTQPTFTLGGNISVGVTFLGGAHLGGGPVALISFSSLEVGAKLRDGGPALGRRVMLPWGAAGFDFNSVNADGQTLMKRSIEWAAGLDGS